MIPISTYAGARIAVFGLGISGRASVRALLAGGAQLSAWDDSEHSRDVAIEKGIELFNLHEADWSKFSALVLAPGVPLTHPEPHPIVVRARNAGVAIIGDTELFFLEREARAADSGVIAITGTNGKSTTTALTTHILKAAGFDAVMGGNIGEAVLDLPDFAPGKIYVLEMSSYQLDLTPSVAPNAAALLNITPDHIDRHGTVENYAKVKARIFRNLGPGDAAVISLDDLLCRNISSALDGPYEKLEVSSLSGIAGGIGFNQDNIWQMRDGVKEAEIPVCRNDALRGLHNKQNAAFAYGLARHMGAAPEALEAGLMSFPGLRHRMEIIGRLAGHLIINDSKATNGEAAAQALSAFEKIYWIAGGRAKEGGLGGLDALFPRIRKAYLIGECAADFGEALDGTAPWVESITIEEAVRSALADLGSEGLDDAVVLLSPAAASFDQFANFEIRGDAFCDAVRQFGDVEMVEGRQK